MSIGCLLQGPMLLDMSLVYTCAMSLESAFVAGTAGLTSYFNLQTADCVQIVTSAVHACVVSVQVLGLQSALF